MKEYIFENKLNSNIQIIIKAHSYSQAMDFLISLIENTDYYTLIN